MRKGIVSAGNWLSDTIKFISHYPAVGNLVTIEKIDQGFGGCAHNVLADLARMQTGIPLYAGGCVGKDALGDEIFSTCEKLGINADGMPMMEVVNSEEYVTVNPNDLTQAKRACKLADKKVLPDTVRVNVLREEVRAMSLEQFYCDSDMVERQANGRVK